MTVQPFDPALLLVPEDPLPLPPDEIIVLTLPAEDPAAPEPPAAILLPALPPAGTPADLPPPAEDPAAPPALAVVVTAADPAPAPATLPDPLPAAAPALPPPAVTPDPPPAIVPPADPTPPGQVPEDAFATPDDLAAMLAAINQGPADPGDAVRAGVLDALGLDAGLAADPAAFEAAVRAYVPPDEDQALAQWLSAPDAATWGWTEILQDPPADWPL